MPGPTVTSRLTARVEGRFLLTPDGLISHVEVESTTYQGRLLHLETAPGTGFIRPELAVTWVAARLREFLEEACEPFPDQRR